MKFIKNIKNGMNDKTDKMIIISIVIDQLINYNNTLVFKKVKDRSRKS